MFVSWDTFLAKLIPQDKWNFQFEELIQKRWSLYLSSEKDIHFDTWSLLKRSGQTFPGRTFYLNGLQYKEKEIVTSVYLAS